MPIPKLYRRPGFMLLLLSLIFAGLILMVWYWYQTQLQKLDKQLEKLHHRVKIPE